MWLISVVLIENIGVCIQVCWETTFNCIFHTYALSKINYRFHGNLVEWVQLPVQVKHYVTQRKHTESRLFGSGNGAEWKFTQQWPWARSFVSMSILTKTSSNQALWDCIDNTVSYAICMEMISSALIFDWWLVIHQFNCLMFILVVFRRRIIVNANDSTAILSDFWKVVQD